MKDRSLSLFLIFFFGLTGLAVVLVAWLQPGLASDRIAATVAGSVGLVVSLARAFTLRQPEDEAGQEHATVEVEAKDNG
jgi:hypothetical protein